MSDFSAVSSRSVFANGPSGELAQNATGEQQRPPTQAQSVTFSDMLLNICKPGSAPNSDLEANDLEETTAVRDESDETPTSPDTTLEAEKDGESRDPETEKTTIESGDIEHLGEPTALPHAAIPDAEHGKNNAQTIATFSGEMQHAAPTSHKTVTAPRQEPAQAYNSQAIQTISDGDTPIIRAQFTGQNTAGELPLARKPLTAPQPDNQPMNHPNPQISSFQSDGKHTHQVQVEELPARIFEGMDPRIPATPEPTMPRITSMEKPSPSLSSFSGKAARVSPLLTGQTAPSDQIDDGPDTLGVSSIIAAREPGSLAASVSILHSPGRPEVPRHIASQIASAASAQSNGQVELRLNPEELGRVRLTMTPRDSSMLVSIIAERGETLDLMRRHINLLAEEFQALGFSDLQFDFGTSHQDGERASSTFQNDDSFPFIQLDDANTPDARAQSALFVSQGLDLRF